MELTAKDSMRLLLSPKFPVWPWGPISFLSNGSHRLFLWESSSHSTNLTKHLNLVPKSSMRVAYPPLPHRPSCCGVSAHTSTCTRNMSTSTCILTNIDTCSTAEKVKAKMMQSKWERTTVGNRGKLTGLHKYFFQYKKSNHCTLQHENI